MWLNWKEAGSETHLNSIMETNFRIHLIPMRHFYGVQFINKSVKFLVILQLLFQSAEETFFFPILFIKWTKHVKNNIVQNKIMCRNRLRKIMKLYHWKLVIKILFKISQVYAISFSFSCLLEGFFILNLKTTFWKKLQLKL